MRYVSGWRTGEVMVPCDLKLARLGVTSTAWTTIG